MRLGQRGGDLAAGWSWRGVPAAAGFCVGGCCLVGLVGCASPGPPRPPSLYLPAVVSDLAAERVGGDVVLRWTTSAETTDGLPLGDRAMTAEICRAVGEPGRGACVPVRREAVHSGPSSATDVLPGSLVGGGPEVLGYEVRLLNAAGRSAGWSGVAISAGGTAPPPVTRVAVRATERGAEITWAPAAGEAGFEIERVEVAGGGTAGGGAVQKTAQKAGGGSKDVGVRLSVPGGSDGSNGKVGGDPGGALDAGAVMGKTYVYRVQRVRRVELPGHRVEIRGAMSAPAEVRMRDVFPPAPPTGLAGVAGCVGRELGVDLSWEPNGERDLAGYFVYRADGVEGGEWTKLMVQPVAAPEFRDTGIRAGGPLRFRVTAIDRSGNESAPSSVFLVAAEQMRAESCSDGR